MNGFSSLWNDSGIAQMQFDQLTMIFVCLLLLYLAIRRGFEPLLLVPIGFGGMLHFLITFHQFLQNVCRNGTFNCFKLLCRHAMCR